MVSPAPTTVGMCDTYVSIEGLVGSMLNDGLIGNDVANNIYGNDGDDFIFGRDDDYLNGGPANDRLFGEADSDFLVGGPGADALDGGPEFDWAWIRFCRHRRDGQRRAANLGGGLWSWVGGGRHTDGGAGEFQCCRVEFRNQWLFHFRQCRCGARDAVLGLDRRQRS